MKNKEQMNELLLIEGQLRSLREDVQRSWFILNKRRNENPSDNLKYYCRILHNIDLKLTDEISSVVEKEEELKTLKNVFCND
jgi:hypothetical protein